MRLSLIHISSNTLPAAKLSPLLYNIGDSFAAGRVLEATRAAYALATKL